MAETTGKFEFTVESAVGTLVIDRPEKLNTVTIDMARQLYDIVDEINQVDDIRCVVVTGRGDRAFCAGSDVSRLDDYGDSWRLRNRADYRQDYIAALRAVRKPLIAAMRGYVYGGGLEMALVCDIRIASPSARFAASEVKLGWHAGSGETQYLARIVGMGKAAQMLLTGEPIDADAALRWRLIEELVSEDELLLRAGELAASIASNPPIAVQLTKHLVRLSQSTPLEAALAFENDLYTYCVTTEDSKEGIRAFRERRKPRFRGG